MEAYENDELIAELYRRGVDIERIYALYFELDSQSNRDLAVNNLGLGEDIDASWS